MINDPTEKAEIHSRQLEQETLSAVRMGDEIRNCGTYPNGRLWRIERVAGIRRHSEMRHGAAPDRECDREPL